MFTLALLSLVSIAPAGGSSLSDTLVRWEEKHLMASVRPQWLETGWAGGHRVRMRADAHGLPVDNLHLVLGLRGDGSLRRQYGELPTLGPPHPSPVTKEAALQRAEEVFARWGRGSLWDPWAQQVYYVDAANQGHHAWRVKGSTARPLQTFSLWLDASDGRPLGIRKESYSGQGNIYPRSPAQSDLATVELLNGSFGLLKGDYATAHSCDDWIIDDSFFGINQCYETSQHAIADSNGDFFFVDDAASMTDPLAEVQAFYHTEKLARHLDETMGFAHDVPIEVTVNFPMANAFFADFNGDGTGDISFGQSDEGIDFAYDADVVYHEFGHSVIDAISRLGSLSADELGLVWTSGALHEGSADAFSMFLTASPALGEYAGTRDGISQPIRDLSFPRTCPEDLRSEVHADGEIWASLFWALIADEAIGASLAQELLFAAASTWGPDITWPKAGASLADASAELLEAGLSSQATHERVLTHLDTSSISDCERIIDLLAVESSTQYLMNLGLYDDFAQIPAGNQFRLTLPEEAVAIALSFSGFTSASEHLGMRLFLREGEPIRHEVTSADAIGLGMAVPTDFDYTVDLGQEDTTVVIGEGQEYPLTPGNTYYLSIASLNLGGIELLDFTTGRVEISATARFPGPTPDPEESSCGCQSTGFRTYSVTFFGGALLFGLLRRRALWPPIS
jgi:hypothetical protein